MTAHTVEATLFTKVTPPAILGQRLCHGVFLTKDVHIAEVAQERVGQHVQQQAGTGRNDHLDEIAGAVLVEVAQLECLVRHGTAGDADDELEHKGGDGVARVTGQISASARPMAPARPPDTPSSSRAVRAVKVLPRWNEEPP